MIGIGIGITLWASNAAAGGASTAGAPIGLLLTLTKAS